MMRVICCLVAQSAPLVTTLPIIRTLAQTPTQLQTSLLIRLVLRLVMHLECMSMDNGARPEKDCQAARLQIPLVPIMAIPPHPQAHTNNNARQATAATVYRIPFCPERFVCVRANRFSLKTFRMTLSYLTLSPTSFSNTLVHTAEHNTNIRMRLVADWWVRNLVDLRQLTAICAIHRWVPEVRRKGKVF